MVVFKSFLLLALFLGSKAENINGVLPQYKSVNYAEKYGTYCYGFSSVFSEERHKQNTVSRRQKVWETYRHCKKIIGNLILTDVDDGDFKHIVEVTGFVMIVNPSTDIDLSGLRIIHGQELGTGIHKDAALIVQGGKNFGDTAFMYMEQIITLNKELKIVRGGISVSGNVGCQFSDVCESELEALNDVLAPGYSVKLANVENPKGCKNDDKCWEIKGNNDPVCEGEEYLTKDGTCGKCAKTLNRFCVDECPPDTLEHENTCVYTCPEGFTYNPKVGDFKCAPCQPVVNPSTNHFSGRNCPRGCYIGYRMYTTLIQWREFYPNPEFGGLRRFDTSPQRIGDFSEFCVYLYGNLALQIDNDDKDGMRRFIPGTQLHVLNHVKAVTGFVDIHLKDKVYHPHGMFRHLEDPMGGIEFDVDYLDLAHLNSAIDEGYIEKFKSRFGIEPIKTRKTTIHKWDNNVKDCNGRGKKVERRVGVDHVHVCLNRFEYNDIFLNGDEYKLCHHECDGCYKDTAMHCKKCKHVLLDSFNLKTCLKACPHGYYQWRGDKCFRCAPECGGYGCNKGKALLDAKEGCKKCELSALVSEDNGSYKVRCLRAPKDDNNFIEEAFKKYLI